MTLENRAVGAIITRGALAGLLAGAAFMLFQMGVTAMLDQPALAPLRLAATIVLGPRTLADPTAPLLIGAGVHVLLSLAYGAAFWVVMAARDMLITEPLEVMARYSILYATGLWLFNGLLLARFVFQQFWGVRPVLFAVAHIVVFGPALMAATGLLRDRIVSLEFDRFHAEEYRIRRLQQQAPYHEVGFEEGEELPPPADP